MKALNYLAKSLSKREVRLRCRLRSQVGALEHDIAQISAQALYQTVHRLYLNARSHLIVCGKALIYFSYVYLSKRISATILLYKRPHSYFASIRQSIQTDHLWRGWSHIRFHHWR